MLKLSPKLGCLLVLTNMIMLVSAYAAFAAKPILYYSDLVDGPKATGKDNNGAFVTIWGIFFGPVRGTSYVTVGSGEVVDYLVWKTNKVTFQLGASVSTGNIVLHTGEGDSNGLPFTVNNGHIHFTDVNAPNNPGSGTYADPWKSPRSFYTQATAGDILYFRGGTYAEEYGSSYGNYQIAVDKPGSEGLTISWVGYPGEKAVIRGGSWTRTFYFSAGAPKYGHYNTVSQLIMDGNGSYSAGGVAAAGSYLLEGSGAHHIRIVGCRITNWAKSPSNTTMTGNITINNDDSSVLGCQFDNLGLWDHVYNNNHAIYIQSGADNVTIAYNYVYNTAAGHVVQIHADSVAGRQQYDNVRIHSNVFVASSPGILRGPTMSNILNDTTVYFYNNILSGFDVSGFQIYNGTVYIFNNVFYQPSGSTAPAFRVVGGSAEFAPKLIAKNNIFYASKYVDFGGEKALVGWGNVEMQANCYYGAGIGPEIDSQAISADPKFVNASGGNFSLYEDSPCKDKGVDVSAYFQNDALGLARPQGLGWDIGAYEDVDNTPPGAPSGFGN